MLDKVMQLNEHIRVYVSSETLPEGKFSSPFAYITYFENWKRRLAKLTDWMYDEVSDAILCSFNDATVSRSECAS